MQTFSVTPQGITFKGDTMLPRCEQYVKKAQLLYQQVTPKDWEDRTPHLANQIPVLAKINMLLALANPLSLEKAGFNPDQARDEDGRWTDEGGGYKVWNWQFKEYFRHTNHSKQWSHTLF